MTTRVAPWVRIVLLLAGFGLVVGGGAGLISGVWPGLDTSAMAVALAFSILLGVSVGAALVSHLRSGELRREENLWNAEVDTLPAGPSSCRCVSFPPALNLKVAGPDRRAARRLERGEIAQDRFDAALDEELQEVAFQERERSVRDRRAPGPSDRRD